MLYMVVEHFRGGDAVSVYRRFRDRGRLVPDGLRHVDSWVSADLTHCYQLMECEDRDLIDRWTAGWADLVEFSVTPVVTSAEALRTLTPQL